MNTFSCMFTCVCVCVCVLLVVFIYLCDLLTAQNDIFPVYHGYEDCVTVAAHMSTLPAAHIPPVTRPYRRGGAWV